MEETQSLPNSESCINSLPNKENIIDHQEMTTPSSLSIKTATETATTNSTNNLNLSEMTTKTVDEISAKIEQVFSKLQRNLEHNTRIFQEKSNGLLAKIDQAEEQLRKVLSQLEAAAFNKTTSASFNESPTLEESPAIVIGATESIALSEETTKLEVDETTAN
jgi:ElaB/YqjD/DUF883 family membrane-anchored ribosome-binding protein